MLRPSAQIASAPGDRSIHRLEAIRAELDRVDDALHDGLMRRAELVAQVAALGAKGRVPLRPGREASIIRRLVARNRGALDPSALVRLWRELLAGSTAQQQPMRVVAGDPAVLPSARAHFGTAAPTAAVSGPAALEALRCGEAIAAVMPWPGAWWAALLDQPGAMLHVVARLPFWAGGERLPPCLVLTAAAPDPSGDDRSLLASRTPGFAADGFEVGALTSVAGAVLADVRGFVTPDDPRLPPGATVLGAYAIPIGDTA